jgi:predicted nuclease of predicted toxin-antitoxin system
MRFLVDAQLPRRLAAWLNETGFDTVHTLELPLGNRTSDTLINDVSINEQRIVITKDSDFVDSFLLHKKPSRLLLISTGNIRNAELEALFQANIEKLKEAFEAGFEFVELNQTAIVIHS